MENLRKTRGTARSTATRLEKRVNEEIKGAKDKQKIKVLLDEVSKVQLELIRLDQEIYQGLIDEDSSQEELDKDSSESATYREKLGLARSLLDEALNGSAYDLVDKMKCKVGDARSVSDSLMTKAREELNKEVVETIQLQSYLKLLQDQRTEEQHLFGELMDAMIDVGVNDEERAGERDQNLNRRIDFEGLINQLEKVVNPRSSSPVPSISSSNGEVTSSLRIRPLVPIQFDGQFENWLTWWVSFKEVHEDKGLSDSSKLRTLLEGMAPNTTGYKIVTRCSLMDNAYDEAIKALQSRFGDVQILTNLYIGKIARLMDPHASRPATLPEICEELETHLQSMSTLGVKKETVAFLFPFIEKMLPPGTREAWQRNPLAGYVDEKVLRPEEQLQNLMKFLRLEVKAHERMGLSTANVKAADKKEEAQFKKPVEKKKEVNVKGKRKPDEDVPTAAGLTTKRTKFPCIFCERENHASQDCRTAAEWSREEKQSTVEAKNACFRCLIPGHISKDCKVQVKCVVCRGKHYAIMCYHAEQFRSDKSRGNREFKNRSHSLPPRKRREDDKRSRSKSKDKGGKNERRNHAVTSHSSNFSTKDLVLLKTVIVRACGPKGERRVRLLVDEGSQVSYIGKNTTEVIGANTVETETVQNVLLGGITTDFHTEHIKKVILKSIDDTSEKSWLLREKPVVCTNLPRVPQGKWIDDLKEEKVEVTDLIGAEVEEENVEILIGSDLRAEIMTGRKIDLGDNLVAEETIFGWALSGPVPRQRLSVSNIMISFCLENMNIQDLWRLETLGIKDPIEAQSRLEEEVEAYKHFLQHLRRDADGRYSVGLPWIENKPKLSPNREIAYRRLQSTTRKVKANEMYKTYDGMFVAWEEEGFVEEVKGEIGGVGVHFLPHHAVLKPNSLTTPVRPVFDASAKTKGKFSLNDCLYKGENLMELIPEVLCGFREGPIGVFSDIRKAFQMIGVNAEDRDFLSFLWWKSDECKMLKVMRHSRVVFGVKSSPFLLGAVLKHHLEKVDDERKEIAVKLLRSLYVDNSLVSVNSAEEYLDFRKIACELLQECQMVLRQWTCTTNEGINEETDIEVRDPIIGVLGLLWNRVEGVSLLLYERR